MKYQTFTDAAGLILFSIVLDEDAAPFEIDSVFGLDAGANDFSLGEYLSPVPKEEPRFEDIQRHLRKLRELPDTDESVKAALEARAIAEEAAKLTAEQVAKVSEEAAAARDKGKA